MCPQPYGLLHARNHEGYKHAKLCEASLRTCPSVSNSSTHTRSIRTLLLVPACGGPSFVTSRPATTQIKNHVSSRPMLFRNWSEGHYLRYIPHMKTWCCCAFLPLRSPATLVFGHLVGPSKRNTACHSLLHVISRPALGGLWLRCLLHLDCLLFLWRLLLIAGSRTNGPAGQHNGFQ